MFCKRQQKPMTNLLDPLVDLYNAGYRYIGSDGTPYTPEQVYKREERFYRTLHIGEPIDPEACRTFCVEQRRKYARIITILSEIKLSAV